MKSPWDAAASNLPDDDPLDRLVDGSLSEAQRRELLLQLESEPDGWRRCALAFLEAQTWREAFAPVAATAIVPAAKSSPKRPVSMLGRRLARWSSLAACVALAFVLGWMSRPDLVDGDRSAHGNAVQPETTAPMVSASPPPAEETRPVDEPRNPVVDSVVRAWEQNGYSAERQKTLVTVTLADGSEVAIPADDIRLRFTAGRTY